MKFKGAYRVYDWTLLLERIFKNVGGLGGPLSAPPPPFVSQQILSYNYEHKHMVLLIINVRYTAGAEHLNKHSINRLNGLDINAFNNLS